MKEFWRRLALSFYEAAFDGCLAAAKGAAYSSLLALFPVMSSLTAILTQVNADAVTKKIGQFLFEVAPPGTEELLEYSITIRGQRPALLLILAVVISMIGASGVMLSLIDGFQAAYRHKNKRNFWKQRGIAIMLVVLVASPAVAMSSLMVYTGSALLLPPAMVAISLGNFLLYRFGPDLPPEMRKSPIWPGALIATGLWMGTTVGFVWYVRNLANYNVMYGSIGAVIALLVWLYLLMFSSLLGCEYNAVTYRERKKTEENMLEASGKIIGI